MRAFKIDTFISHNSEAEAGRLAEALASRGCEVFCDELSDLADRRVEDRMRAALAASRSVLVYVHQAFRDSMWCRSEYTYALHSGLRTNTERVVIAAVHDAVIPERLKQCRRYAVQDSLDDLAAFLRDSNLIPEAVAREVVLQRETIRGSHLTDLRTRRMGHVPQWLQAQMLETHRACSEGGLTPEEEGSLELSMAETSKFLLAADADDRCNATKILVCLAHLTGRPDLHDQVLSYLRREGDPAVLYCVLLHLFAHGGVGTAASTPLAAALLRCAEGPYLFDSSSSFISELPDAVRLRLIDRLELGKHELVERLRLLLQRVEAADSGANEELVLYDLESDLKRLDRELTYELLEENPTATELDDVIPAFCHVVEAILRWAEREEYHPLAMLQGYAVEGILMPLGGMIGHPAAPPSLDELFERACRLVQEHDVRGFTVPPFRELARMRLDGTPFREARARALRTVLELEDLQEQRSIGARLREMGQPVSEEHDS
jgi:hypothetical protein